MNLARIYEGINIGALGNYPAPEIKSLFCRRGKNFLRAACRLAKVSPMKGYPNYNPGGIAVLGDIYCNILHPESKRILEICLSEIGPYYRTNGSGGYGTNIFISEEKMKTFDEHAMSGVIYLFLEGRIK